MDSKSQEEFMNFVRKEPENILRILIDTRASHQFSSIVGRETRLRNFWGHTPPVELKKYLQTGSAKLGISQCLGFLEGFMDLRPRGRQESKDEKAIQDHHYEYIPLSEYTFYSIVDKAVKLMKRREVKPESFIDIGCGMRDKSMLAFFLFGLEPHGIEYTKQTFDEGEKKYWYKPHNFILGDALEFDYGKYDINYMYCPMRVDDMMYKLYYQVLKTMRVNSVMVSCLTLESLRRALKDLNLPITNKQVIRSHQNVVLFRNENSVEVYSN